jgi:hypothetical protein
MAVSAATASEIATKFKTSIKTIERKASARNLNKRRPGRDRVEGEEVSSSKRPVPPSVQFSAMDYIARASDAECPSVLALPASLSGPDFCFIFAPCGDDEPEILPP